MSVTRPLLNPVRRAGFKSADVGKISCNPKEVVRPEKKYSLENHVGKPCY